MSMKGIDVSKHQGTVNWSHVKADGVKFAIIRAGYGKQASQKDTQFEANYTGCKAQGIPCGASWRVLVFLRNHTGRGKKRSCCLPERYQGQDVRVPRVF